MRNRIFELSQSIKLNGINYEIVLSKLNMMYESIDAMANTKYIEDKYQFQLDERQKRVDTYLHENALLIA